MEPLSRHEAIALAIAVFGGSPDRLRILLACAEGPTSARDVAERTDDGDDLSKIAYHVRKLAEDGLIRFVSERRVRGAFAKFYVASKDGQKLLRQLGLPEDASA